MSDPYASIAMPVAQADPYASVATRVDQKPQGPVSSHNGVDFTKSTTEVRAAIAALPDDQRQRTLDKWADYYISQERTKPAPNLDAIDDRLRAVARGTPVGSWLDRANAGTAAALHSISNGVLGAPYDESLAYQRARDRGFDTSNPKESTALKLGGALVSAPATPMAAPFAAGSMVGRIGNAAVTGAGYGALYGAGQTEDLQDPAKVAADAAKGAGIGAGVGAAAVPIATGIGNVAKYAADKYRGIPAELQGTSRGAVDRVSRAMADDALYVPSPNAPPPAPSGTRYGNKAYNVQAAELGPQGMLADMGPNLLSQVKGLTTQRGSAQDILKMAIEGRSEGAKDRIAATIDGNLGPARNLVQAEKAAIDAGKQASAPHWDAFYKAQIPITPEVEALIKRADAAGVVGQAKRLMDIEGKQPQSMGQFVDYLKRGADDLARNAKPGSNEERLFKGLSADIRGTIDKLLSPGDPSKSPWALARKASGDGLQYREGLEIGRKVFDRGTHPDQLAADVAGMNAVQAQGVREGGRGAIRDIAGNASTQWGENAGAAVRSKLGGDYARDKLAQIVGDPAKAGRITRTLDAETQFARTRKEAYQGTETAARLAAQKEFPQAGNHGENAVRFSEGGIGAITARIAHRLANALTGGHIDAKNAQIATDAAKMLAAQGRSRDVIAAALMKYGRGRAITTKGRDAITRLAEELMQVPRSVLIDENAKAASGRR